MSAQATILKTQKTITFSPILWVNQFISREKTNAIGITLGYIMAGSGVGSITAALSIHNVINMPILMTSISLAMATNCVVLSQQSFKITTWVFIVSIIVNSLLLIFQLTRLTF